MNRWTKLLLGGAALALGCAAVATVPQMVAAEDAEDPSMPFDPTLAALEVDTEDELAEFEAALERASEEARLAPQSGLTVEISPTGEVKETAEQTRPETAQTDFEAAVDSLYQEASQTSEGEQGRRQWRSCMVDRGYPYESPMQIDTEFSAHPPLSKERESRDWPAIWAAQEHCDSTSAAILNPVLEKLFPEWERDNSAVIDAYAASLGLK